MTAPNPLALCPGCGEGLIVPDRFSNCANCGLHGEELARLLAEKPPRIFGRDPPLVAGGQGRDADEIEQAGIDGCLILACLGTAGIFALVIIGAVTVIGWWAS